MPCELKGFRGLDISKGVFLVPEKAFLGVPFRTLPPNDIFCHLSHPAGKHLLRGGQVPALAFEYSARSLYAGHRLPPVVQAHPPIH